ncbi:MAG: hypothetical protein AABZ80_07060 [Gemmatimonadota bacterium]
MTHRHLLPNEIDLLLDEESGFGVRPLREHVRGCADCRDRLDAAKRVASRLSELPLIAPRYGMADRVMAQVPVFVPWHEAARDAVTPWIPTGRVPRLAAAAVTGVAGTLITGGTLWVAARGDLVATLTGLAGEGAQAAATDAAGSFVVAVFGPQVVTVMQQMGAWGLVAAAGGFAAASLATIVGLRHVATTTRARS